MKAMQVYLLIIAIVGAVLLTALIVDSVHGDEPPVDAKRKKDPKPPEPKPLPPLPPRGPEPGKQREANDRRTP